MTHDQLRAFAAVVDTGSFRGAATQLHKTQSTISHAIKTLEAEFQLQLFDRSHYRPTLTPAGRAFYQQTRELLSSTQTLERLGHQLALGTPPTLSLSISTMCAHPLPLQALSQFTEHHPDLQLALSTQHLSGVLEPLHKDTADIAIGPNRGLDLRYEFTEIYRVCVRCVVASHHGVLSEGSRVSRERLRKIPHILIADSGTESPFEHVNVIPGGQQWYVNDYAIKRTLLLAGLGWSRMPTHLIEEDLAQKTLIPLEVENFASHSQVPIYLIRLKHKPLSPLASEFWQTMVETFTL